MHRNALIAELREDKGKGWNDHNAATNSEQTRNQASKRTGRDKGCQHWQIRSKRFNHALSLQCAQA